MLNKEKPLRLKILKSCSRILVYELCDIEYTGKINKDLKLAIKRGLNISLFKTVVEILEKEGKLPPKYKAHILKGNYKGLWECHIQPDWLLIWKQDDSIQLISLTRTGSHSDLFK